MHEVHRRTALCVVPLNPNEVEVGLGYRVAKLCIGNLALRRTRYVKGFVWEVGKVTTETLNHSSIAISAIMFNIEIKSVNLIVLERTREASILARRAERIPQEIGKPFRNLVAGNILVGSLATK